jgi:LmbE family N-acetylglucosaminyl deacetylase
VLSPHSDDAAFSVVGILSALAKSGTKVTIITCFSRSRFTRLGTCCVVETITAARKGEDECFARMLGEACTPAWLDLNDASLRLNGVSEMFEERPLRAEENELACLISRRLSSLLGTSSVLFSPLGIGGHIDHRIVLQATKASARCKRLTVLFYEDMPYATLVPESKCAAVARDLALELGMELLPHSVSLPNILELKRRAAACYGSQVMPSDLHVLEIAARRFREERIWLVDHREVLPTSGNGGIKSMADPKTLLARAVN